MNACKYFKFEFKAKPKSKEIFADRQQRSSGEDRISWCSHPKHSQVDIEVARCAAKDGVGSGNLLQCEGNLAKCLLTDDQLIDV